VKKLSAIATTIEGNITRSRISRCSMSQKITSTSTATHTLLMRRTGTGPKW